MVGRTVTVEKGDELDRHAGKRATVIAVREPFVIIDIENVGIRGTLIECVQVVPTAADFATTGEDES